MDPVALWHDAPLWQITALSGVYLLALYLAFALATTWLTTRVLPSLGVGRVLDARPRPKGQRRREARLAVRAVFMFALWTPVLAGLDRAGVIQVDMAFAPGAVALELCALLVWNEVHFLAVHRVLHTRFLYRAVHAVHHRSTVPSPFSTYAMHPVEALLLGSVLVPVTFVWDLHHATLSLYAVASLLLNTIGHANYGLGGALETCARAHVEHHRRGHGLYGFVSAGVRAPWRSPMQRAAREPAMREA